MNPCWTKVLMPLKKQQQQQKTPNLTKFLNRSVSWSLTGASWYTILDQLQQLVTRCSYYLKVIKLVFGTWWLIDQLMICLDQSKLDILTGNVCWVWLFDVANLKKCIFPVLSLPSLLDEKLIWGSVWDWILTSKLKLTGLIFVFQICWWQLYFWTDSNTLIKLSSSLAIQCMMFFSAVYECNLHAKLFLSLSFYPVFRENHNIVSS